MLTSLALGCNFSLRCTHSEPLPSVNSGALTGALIVPAKAPSFHWLPLNNSLSPASGTLSQCTPHFFQKCRETVRFGGKAPWRIHKCIPVPIVRHRIWLVLKALGDDTWAHDTPQPWNEWESHLSHLTLQSFLMKLLLMPCRQNRTKLAP